MYPNYQTGRATQARAQALIEQLAYEREVLGERLERSQRALTALTQQHQQQLKQSQQQLGQREHQLDALKRDNEALTQRIQALEQTLTQLEQAAPPAPIPAAPAPLAQVAERGRADKAMLEDFMAVRDHLGQALEMSQDTSNPWHQGIAHILEQFDQTLGRHQLKRFGEVGERFDPARHEAIDTAQQEDVPAGQIVRVIKPGFSFEDGTLARAAQVVVSR